MRAFLRKPEKNNDRFCSGLCSERMHQVLNLGHSYLIFKYCILWDSFPQGSRFWRGLLQHTIARRLIVAALLCRADGFSAKNEDLENLVGRQDWWAMIPANVFLLCASLSWPRWRACPLLVSLFSPLCRSESEDSSDLKSWIYSSNSMCSVSSFFMTLSGPMYYTLSLTVFKCTTCQQSKPHQRNRFFFVGSWPLHSCL